MRGFLRYFDFCGARFVHIPSKSAQVGESPFTELPSVFNHNKC